LHDGTPRRLVVVAAVVRRNAFSFRLRTASSSPRGGSRILISLIPCPGVPRVGGNRLCTGAGDAVLDAGPVEPLADVEVLGSDIVLQHLAGGDSVSFDSHRCSRMEKLGAAP